MSTTRDQYVLRLLQQGLRLSFNSQPLLTTSQVPFPLPEASSKSEHLGAEILSMLVKGAIERVANKSSLGFYSLLFVIPKTNGKLRLVIDLRPLNHHLTKERFHMGRPSNLCPSVLKGGCVISMDVTDAYLHVLILPSSRTFLCCPVSCSTFWLVSKPKSLHSRGGCHDGPCSISGLKDSPLSGRQAFKKQADGPPQGSNSEPSSLNYSPWLDIQPGEVRAYPNSRLRFHCHALSSRSGADVPSSGPFQGDSQPCLSDPPCKAWCTSGLSLAFGETGVNNRSSTTRPSQTSASSALPIGSLASQPGSVDGQDSVGSPVLGPKSEMVIQAAQCSSGEVHQGSDSPVGNVHGYLHKRLNGSLWQSVDNRSG